MARLSRVLVLSHFVGLLRHPRNHHIYNTMPRTCHFHRMEHYWYEALIISLYSTCKINERWYSVILAELGIIEQTQKLSRTIFCDVTRDATGRTIHCNCNDQIFKANNCQKTLRVSPTHVTCIFFEHRITNNEIPTFHRTFYRKIMFRNSWKRFTDFWAIESDHSCKIARRATIMRKIKRE